MGPEELFAGNPLAIAVFGRVRSLLEAMGPVDVRTTKSQVAFWRSHGFAYLWAPGHYLRHPDAEVVLSIALGRRDGSPRFKEVVHPSPRHWMHHLEIRSVEDLDDEVRAWLLEAAERAS